MSKIVQKKKENSNFIIANYEKNGGLHLDFSQIKHQNNSIPLNFINRNNKKNISPNPYSGRIKKKIGNNSFNLTTNSANISVNNSVRKKKVTTSRIKTSYSSSKQKNLSNNQSLNDSNISIVNNKKKLNLSYSRSQTTNIPKNNSNKLNKSLSSGASPMIINQRKKSKIGNKSLSPFMMNMKIKKIISPKINNNTYTHLNNHSNNINNNSLNHTSNFSNKNYFQPKNIFSGFKRKKNDDEKIKKYYLMNNSANFIKQTQKNINVSPYNIPKNISMLYQDKETITSESILSNHMNNIHKINQIEERKNSENQKIQTPQPISTENLLNISNSIQNSITQNKIIKNPNNIKKIKCMHDLSKTGMSGDEKKVNQDTYFIFKNFGNSFENIYMGVCDGHGYYGHEVSGYIRENLPMDLNHMIKAKKLNLQKDDLSETIIQAFITENNSLLRNKMIDSNLSGTTCISVIYTPLKLIIANIGDSRCILGKLNKNNKWECENLSRDHKPTLPEEAERIKKKGGRIRPMKDEDGSYVGPLRVYMKDRDMPGLAMTRSFGDYFASTAGTICTPEITEHYFSQDDKFIILASDGLFEFIDSDEVVSIVKDYYLGNDIVACCEFLYKESCRRWIQEEEDTIDDITIIVVFFE